MKFELLIESDCTLRSRLDVAWVLDNVAKRLRANTEISKAPIFDLENVMCGHWTIADDDATPIEDPSPLNGGTGMNLREVNTIGGDVDFAIQNRHRDLRESVKSLAQQMGERGGDPVDWSKLLLALVERF